MAARFKTITYTATSTAGKTIYEILGSSPNDKYVSTVAIRAGASNAGTVRWHDGDGSYGGHLNPDDAVTLDLAGKYVSGEDVVVVATTSDVVEITVIG